MIQGSVTKNRPTVPLTFLLPGHPPFRISFVVDTGFSEFLTLPPQAVEAMELPYVGELQAWLADGTPRAVPVHRAQIRWHEGPREVLVAVMENKMPLLGMALLRESRLVVDCYEMGIVEIAPIPPV